MPYVAEEIDEYHLAQTFRSVSGRRRVTFRPDWSKETPWVSYYHGTAGLHFKDLETAQLYHTSWGDPLTIKKEEK